MIEENGITSHDFPNVQPDEIQLTETDEKTTNWALVAFRFLFAFGCGYVARNLYRDGRTIAAITIGIIGTLIFACASAIFGSKPTAEIEEDDDEVDEEDVRQIIEEKEEVLQEIVNQLIKEGKNEIPTQTSIIEQPIVLEEQLTDPLIKDNENKAQIQNQKPTQTDTSTSKTAIVEQKKTLSEEEKKFYINFYDIIKTTNILIDNVKKDTKLTNAEKRDKIVKRVDLALTQAEKHIPNENIKKDNDKSLIGLKLLIKTFKEFTTTLNNDIWKNIPIKTPAKVIGMNYKYVDDNRKEVITVLSKQDMVDLSKQKYECILTILAAITRDLDKLTK